jgi:hypothetical protein
MIAGLPRNRDFLIPDSGLQNTNNWDASQPTNCNNNLSCAVIRPAGFVTPLCSRRTIRPPKGEPLCWYPVADVHREWAGRILGKTVFGALTDRSFRRRRIDEILGLTRG